MNDKDAMRERLSALADGELQGEEFASAVAHAGTPEGQSDWRMYHLIGDTLRSGQVPHVADPALLGRLREQLAREPRPASVTQEAVVLAKVPQPSLEAANASMFRWKLVAGFASLAAVVAVGWNSHTEPAASGAPQAAQLAVIQQQPAPGAWPPPFVATAETPDTPQVMIRDPRLDELLAAHKQFGNTTALQMPAGFLRNATFDAPRR